MARNLLDLTYDEGAVSALVEAGGTELKLTLTLELADADSPLALSAEGLVQWLGTTPPRAAGVLGARFYPLELCEERFATPGLIADVLSRK